MVHSLNISHKLTSCSQNSADVALVPPPGKLDKTCASSLIMAYFLNHMKT